MNNNLLKGQICKRIIKFIRLQEFKIKDKDFKQTQMKILIS